MEYSKLYGFSEPLPVPEMHIQVGFPIQWANILPKKIASISPTSS